MDEKIKVQILEIDTFWHLLVKFTSETVKDRGNNIMSIYHRKFSTQSIQEKNHIKIGWNIYKLYIPGTFQTNTFSKFGPSLDPVSKKTIKFNGPSTFEPIQWTFWKKKKRKEKWPR